ncbi:hypothetical protein QOZ80_6AG0522850 [Eleusine coracana subsp. coracana]|nr:hypothetical protein QOZ80_6AG0522850 [Eleusine coracana subsp. coracana]
MAQKTLCECSAPSAANVPVGPAGNVGDANFEIKTGLVTMNFYNGLTPSAHDHLDAVAGGAFFSLTVSKEKELIEKMVSTQGWSEDRLQPRPRGMHSVKEVDMLAAKIDLLMKKMDDQAKEKHMGESGKISGQPETPLENVNVVTMRGGKSTRDPPYPNTTGKEKKSTQVEKPAEEKEQEAMLLRKTAPYEFYDTNFMPFPKRKRKLTVDEQFTCFVEVIQKLHINVPLMDAMQVPTYACYLKDLISNKRPMQTTEIVKLTEECSAAIFNRLPQKKKDSGCPTITCSIGTQNFDHALCDIDASVSVMPKDVFDKLNYTALAPTPMQLQLADSSVRYLAGIAKDIPVKIRDCFIPVDFVVLDMDVGKETPLIFGRPFLSTVDACIDVGAGEIHFHINGKEEKFDFRPRKEQCNMICIKYGPNPNNIN